MAEEMILVEDRFLRWKIAAMPDAAIIDERREDGFLREEVAAQCGEDGVLRKKVAQIERGQVLLAREERR
jgi:hypothetical protein